MMDKAEVPLQAAAQSTSLSAGKVSGYMPHLDGVRGISILLVVFSHVGFGNIVPGGLGVTVFFFISGFLITSLLRQEKESTGEISLTRFYMRRVWRLYPALLIYVIISMAFSFAMGQKIELKEPIFAIFYLSNYYNLFYGYTPILETYSPFGIQGSLAIEEHFYLIFAPLFLIIKSKKNLIKILILILVIPLILRIGIVVWLDSSKFASDYTYGATECRLDCIAYGCLMALIDWPKFTKIQYNKIAGFGIFLIILSLIFRESFFRETIRFSIQGIGLLCIFLPIIYSTNHEKIRSYLSSQVLVYFGKLSYSIYLYHWLIVIALRIIYGEISISFEWQILFWVFTLAFSMISYYLIETPFMSFRRRYGSHV
jgi:peptidoglycan/LPS O-acetylase OafA/YrhL